MRRNISTYVTLAFIGQIALLSFGVIISVILGYAGVETILIDEAIIKLNQIFVPVSKAFGIIIAFSFTINGLNSLKGK